MLDTAGYFTRWYNLFCLLKKSRWFAVSAAAVSDFGVMFSLLVLAADTSL